MKEDYVSRSIFQWTIGILISLTFSIVGVIYNKTDNLEIELNTYKTDQYKLLIDMNSKISSIATDMSWVKSTLQGYEIEQ